MNMSIEAQIEACEKRTIFRMIKASEQPVRPQLAKIAQPKRRGWTVASLNNLYIRWIAGGCRDHVLVNRHRLPHLWNCKQSPRPPEAFLIWFCKILAKHPTFAGAHRFAIERWRIWATSGSKAHAIPGYSKCPKDTGNGFPAGWSCPNLRKAISAVEAVAPIAVSLTLKGTSKDLERWALTFLAERGFEIAKAGSGWETPAQVCRRLHISGMTLSERLQSRRKPEAEIIRSGFGTVVSIASNPVFDAWIKGVKRSSFAK